MSPNLESLPYRGLTSQQAAEQTAKGLCNKQPRMAGKSTPQILAGNFFTLFNLLNFILAAALTAVGSYRNLLFLGVVVSNTVIGTVQELRAKRTIDKLQLLSAPMVCVIRDGKPMRVSMEAVVLDDLIRVESGNQLCADAEVIAGNGALNESLLTGESEPVDKAPGDTLLSGSFVTEGALYARVTKVGAESYAAQVTMRARTIKKPHSELMQSMRTIIRAVSALIIPLGVILFVKSHYLLGRPVDEAVTSTVAAVLGMIPEGLMLLTSMALAVGVIRLGRRKALVQELYGIESLARVDTLCLDKTGTITKGIMAVTEVVPLAGDQPEADIHAQVGALAASLADNNTTFQALRAFFPAPEGFTCTHTVPFSSARKWSGATFGEKGSVVIGAAEFILGDALDRALCARISTYAEQGSRVLLVCHSPNAMEEKQLPAGLTPQGLVLLSDVLREDAAETLQFFREQGVDIKVISGDNPMTVRSVARMAGLIGEAVDATTLDTPQKLEAAAGRYSIFGRVTPEQKKDLVSALKRAGHTVGMVGDGVNDIPALKASDCSIAMEGGSDAAKRVAQISLLDQNFSAVPHIVLEGRRVINNITRSASLFLVKTTFSFLLSLLLVFIQAHYPFAPIQMTLISSLTVGIPSFFLALEPNRARVRGQFLRNVLANALPGGMAITLQIVAIFLLAGPLGISVEQQSTLATFATGFTGLMVLLHTCRPFLPRRFALVALMSIGFYTIALCFGSLFYLVPLTLPMVVFLACMMVCAAPLMMLVRKAVRMILPTEDAGKA